MEAMDETCLFNLVSELLDADAILLGELQSTYDAWDDDAVIEEPKCLAAVLVAAKISQPDSRRPELSLEACLVKHQFSMPGPKAEVCAQLAGGNSLKGNCREPWPIHKTASAECAKR